MPDALARLLARLEAERASVPEVFSPVRFAPNARLIAQGDSDTTVYLVTAGSLRVDRRSDGRTQEVAQLTAPTIVGELGALSQGRTADVVATTAVEALAVEAFTVRDLCRKDPEFARAFNALVLQRTNAASLESSMRAIAWTAPEEQERLVSALGDLAQQRPEIFTRESFSPDTPEPFIREGQVLDRVYLILAGEAQVLLSEGRVIVVGAGSPLGEIAALSSRAIATATVRFTSEATVLSLSREHFRELRPHAEALVAERLNQMFTRALPQAAKETLRSVRDQNTEALILRSSLDIVHSATGIYRELNPSPAVADAAWGVIRQKSSLIQAVASLLRAARSRAHIATIVSDIREHGLQGMPALKMFKGEAALTREDWLERVDAIYKPCLPAALTVDEFDTIRRRFELLQWLDEMLVADGALDASRLPGATADEKLRGFLRSQEGVAGTSMFDTLDDLFEALMSAGLSRGSPPVVEDLRSVQFNKIRAQVVDPAAAVGVELPRDHPGRLAVTEMRRRLVSGEVSAIGGGDYATQRFPRVLLDRIAQGAIKVVAFDGRPAAGRAFVVSQFAPAARDLGVQPQYMTTEVQGLDGSGGRTLITFRTDGTEVLLLTGLGQSRQRHNAASILLYERSGRRIPEVNLILAAEGVAYVDAIRADLGRVLAEEAERPTVIGTPIDHRTIRTALLVLQHPREFEIAFKEAGCELRYASGALFDFFVGYARIANVVTRYIIPKVGGRGLYGDTAGAFVRACFSAGVANLSPDVIFNGTAGGFLSDVKPGESLLCPTVSISGYDGAERLRTFAVSSRVDNALAARSGGRVTVTSTHVSVGSPGEETYDLIRQFVAQGFQSIDVEGAAIAEAVMDVGARFTPIYTFSDNPLHSEHDRYDSLAVMGPFFEGSRFNAGLWDVLRGLLAHV
jgi:CRP-like cAMP-binding protein